MAYRDDRLESLVPGWGPAAGTATEIRAYYAECKLCPCPAFNGGQNETFCGTCSHHKDDHRY
jgi:hypothetical protein